MPPSKQEIKELVDELYKVKEFLPGFIDLTREQIEKNVINKYDNYIKCRDILTTEHNNIIENRKYEEQSRKSPIFRGSDYNLSPQEFQNLCANTNPEKFRRETLGNFYKLNLPSVIEKCANPDTVIDYYNNNKLLVKVGEGFISQHNSYGNFKKITKDHDFFAKDARMFEDTFILPSSMIGFMGNPISFLFEEKVPALTDDVHAALTRAIYNPNYTQQMQNPKLYAEGIGFLGVAKDYKKQLELGQIMKDKNIDNPIYFKSQNKELSLVKSIESSSPIVTRSQAELDEMVKGYNEKDAKVELVAYPEKTIHFAKPKNQKGIINGDEDLYDNSEPQVDLNNKPKGKKSLVIESENKKNNVINNIVNEESSNDINIFNINNREEELNNLSKLKLNDEQREVYDKLMNIVAFINKGKKDEDKLINITGEELATNIASKWGIYKGYQDIKETMSSNLDANMEFLKKNHIIYSDFSRNCEKSGTSPEEFKEKVKNFNTNEKALFYRDTQLKKLLHSDITKTIDAMVSPSKGLEFFKNNKELVDYGFALHSILQTKSEGTISKEVKDIFNGSKGILGDVCETFHKSIDYNTSTFSFLFDKDLPENKNGILDQLYSNFAVSTKLRDLPGGQEFAEGLMVATEMHQVDKYQKANQTLKELGIKDISKWVSTTTKKMPTLDEVISVDFAARSEKENIDEVFDTYKAAAIESKKRYPRISTPVTKEEEKYLKDAKANSKFKGKFSKDLPLKFRGHVPHEYAEEVEDKLKRTVDQHIEYNKINPVKRFFSHFIFEDWTETGRARAALNKSMDELVGAGYVTQETFDSRVSARRNELNSAKAPNQEPLNQQPLNESNANVNKAKTNQNLIKKQVIFAKDQKNSIEVTNSDEINKEYVIKKDRGAM